MACGVAPSGRGLPVIGVGTPVLVSIDRTSIVPADPLVTKRSVELAGGGGGGGVLLPEELPPPQAQTTPQSVAPRNVRAVQNIAHPRSVGIMAETAAGTRG